MTQYLRVSSRRINNTKNDNDNILNHNQQRSKDHKQEIIENEYPDLNTIKHPKQASASDHMEDADDDEESDDHFYVDRTRPKFEEYVLPHPIWSNEQLESIEITHKKPDRMADYMAYLSVFALRTGWDLSTGYLLGRRLGLFKFSSRMWLLRVTFLETVAGVPGMMFGMVRHLNSLRRLERDRGWINSLLSEAENERIHLLTAMYLYKPGKLMRYAIVIAQGIMCNFLFIAYLLSPRYCHSFVGYLEEQAVHTYTNLLQDIDAGKYPEFEEKCSNLAKAYWKIPSDKATWRTVFANIRADESKHRDVNHQLADIADDIHAVNPFRNEYKTHE